MRQPDLKELAAKVIKRQPPTLEVDQRRAIIAARDASMLSEFPCALKAGRLHVCCNCAHFTFEADPAAPGLCLHYAEGVAPFIPFECRAFTQAREPVAPKYLPEVS